MSFLELKNIKKSYYLGKEEFKVLKGIDLKFERGEMVSILGESGGGKSTLMNIIGGLDSKYDGEVLLNGNSLKHDTSKELDEYRRKTIGFIFQSFNLISHLTILDNVLVSLEMTKLSKKEQLKRAKVLLVKVGLGEQMKKYPNQLSGGQKQRVSIARALASDPEMIIADEPTGALDPQNTVEILKLLDDIAKDGKLVLTVTHSQKVADYGSRIVHMTNGKVDEDKQLKEKYPVKQQDNLESRALSNKSIFKMTLDNMKYNLKRNILIIFGGLIGLFSVLFMLGLGNGVRGYMNHEIYSQINPNSVAINHKDTNNRSPFTQKDIDRIKNVKNVKGVQKNYMATGAQLKIGDKISQAQYFNTINRAMVTNTVKHGSKPGNNEILITKNNAKAFNSKNPYSIVGKKIQVAFNANKSNQTIPVVKTLKVSGISDSQSPLVFVNYQTMKTMLADSGIKIKPNFLSADISGGVGKVDPTQKSINNIKVNGKKAYSVNGAGTIVTSLNTYINLAVYVLAAIAGISLLVSAIMIIVVLYISVSERTKEIGILRALGATKGNIRMLFLNQALLYGVFSSVAAIVISYALQLLINNFTTASIIKYSMMQITPGNAVFAIIIALIINLIAAILPANKGAKLDPIESLSQD
ncbi:ATP-binding cassette domain-containing protein [Apilactobacillus sp. TMW 2.2459]|uniref:ABC transporter ATP-binding protein/permease n=1 Tax=Apilactobacillus xinyiensis TaxID=2841032 RepID=UPI00200FA945|nr:ABC transporter ATP-binding protein/permease [Apilactobacillus xinyiensis]MCL0312450.1 ATP-binding cassette domain-containing protein [Apilactobacillus xinyiensis]